MTRAKLSDDAIRDILTSDDSTTAVAARHSCHRSLVGYVRQGKMHADRLPELPRWTVTCDRCVHWQGACDLGHVDPLEEGTGFARWCASYREAA